MLLTGAADRQSVWERLNEPWDLIVVGGGITGAGILREGVRVGLRVLLLEQNDFASGTSSRSSKLVHGGLRYLNNFQFGMTYQSIAERETLLEEGTGLIEPLPFIYPTYEHDKMPGWMMDIGLHLYGWMGGHWRIHETFDPLDVQMMSPGLSGEHLTGGFRYYEASTDDARLVLRVIREGVATGRALALNYARVERLLRDDTGRVNGVVVGDRETGRSRDVRAPAVVNATGAWADHLRGEVGAGPRIRPLRGSHLLFSGQRFPLFQAIAFPHPDDGRPVFALPWEDVTLLGTTDLDHDGDLDCEPSIAPQEVSYLLRAVQAHFPAMGFTERDVMTTLSGVRPVVGSGHEVDPSKESREHVLWNELGLLTVTGGKLTTFRCIALDALKALRGQLPRMASVDDHLNALDPAPEIDTPPDGLTYKATLRLAARYGAGVLDSLYEWPGELEALGRLPIRWLELRWAARYEAVEHLDDLLLRRVRLGLVAPQGGAAYLPRIRQIVQEELGWGDARWEQEAADYLARWRTHYGTPETVGEAGS